MIVKQKVSKKFLFNEIVKIKDYILRNPKIIIDELLEFNACLEFKPLFLSMNDFENNISDDLKKIIQKYHDLPKTDTRIFKNKLTDFIKEYESIGSKSNEVEWKKLCS